MLRMKRSSRTVVALAATVATVVAVAATPLTAIACNGGVGAP